MKKPNQNQFKLNLQLFAEDKDPNTAPEPKSDESVDDTLPSPEDIQDIKTNYVKKTEFDALKEDYKKVCKIAIDGLEEELPGTPGKGEDVDVSELRKTLFSENISNIKFAETALQLRKTIMDKGGPDPFLPNGRNPQGVFYTATNEDKEAVNKFVDTLEHCIEYAEGDNEAFTNELMRLTNDVAPLNKRGGFTKR